MSNVESTGAENVAGMAVTEVEGIEVYNWHPLPNGEGQPTEVHMHLNLKIFPYPLVMRFKGPRGLDHLIAALVAHRRDVWGSAPTQQQAVNPLRRIQ